MKIHFPPLAVVLLLALSTSGCATKDYVHEYVRQMLNPVSSQVDTLEGKTDAGLKQSTAKQEALGKQVDRLGADLHAQASRIAINETDLAAASKTAREALERAIAAGKLAEGKFRYEMVLSDDTLKFDLEKAEISSEGRAALDEFVGRWLADNRPAFIEIQGHTDSTGPEAFNLVLGKRRAAAVQLYLHRKGIPLQHMGTISYGESEPVADNGTREGRMQNRRVVLVVLR